MKTCFSTYFPGSKHVLYELCMERICSSALGLLKLKASLTVEAPLLVENQNGRERKLVKRMQRFFFGAVADAVIRMFVCSLCCGTNTDYTALSPVWLGCSSQCRCCGLSVRSTGTYFSCRNGSRYSSWDISVLLP